MAEKPPQLYDIPVYPASSTFPYTAIDTFGSIFLATEARGWVVIGGNLTLIEGPCDLELLRSALLKAAATRPVFSSYLAAVGPPTNQRLIWRHQPRPLEVELNEVADTAGVADRPQELLAEMARTAELWEPDLTVEPPTKIRLTRVTDNLTVYTQMGHHARGDGSAATNLTRDAYADYHAAVTGKAPDWALTPSIHSVATSQAPRPVSWRRYFSIIKAHHQEFPVDNVAQIAGQAGTPRPTVVSSYISDESAIDALRLRARASGATVTDLATTAAMLAISEWNEKQGAPARVQRHSIIVNTRGRAPEVALDSERNEVSRIIVGATPADCQNPEQLLLQVAQQRKAMLEQGIDVLNLRRIRGWTKMMGVVPVRRRLAQMGASVPSDLTLIVTNMGVVRPEIVDGKLTGRSVSQEFGKLREGPTMAWNNTAPAAPHALAVIRNESGLMLSLSGNEARNTRAELGQVYGMIFDRLLSFAD